ncbi:hypothetical protein L3X38_043182 [Prunus dulcis]|uniref:Integrase catalytic domain-containing protein n=1 Tax=Prunus dulcis TaxID=3755 RepID=A0AAD4UXN7_PRUDU|nr:hypothetical protein L3X38_043182 [Prunus dulcis]
MQRAIDLVGPLPPSPAKKEMMIVATDYFTKWIEAEALSSTKEADVERFIWRNIICRFGCPQLLVTDNCSQFIGKQITAFFAKYKIKQHLSTPRYPQGNGQSEASNKVILDCLKKRLEGAEGNGWMNSPEYYGLIAPQNEDRLVKPHSPSRLEQRRSYHLTSLSPP